MNSALVQLQKILPILKEIEDLFGSYGLTLHNAPPKFAAKHGYTFCHFVDQGDYHLEWNVIITHKEDSSEREVFLLIVDPLDFGSEAALKFDPQKEEWLKNVKDKDSDEDLFEKINRSDFFEILTNLAKTMKEASKE